MKYNNYYIFKFKLYDIYLEYHELLNFGGVRPVLIKL